MTTSAWSLRALSATAALALMLVAVGCETTTAPAASDDTIDDIAAPVEDAAGGEADATPVEDASAGVEETVTPAEGDAAAEDGAIPDVGPPVDVIVPAEDTPAEDTPAEDTPAEDTPTEDTPATPDPTSDEDGDGFPLSTEEAYGTDPADPTSHPADLDGDKIPDDDDADLDGDGADNVDDAFPEDPAETTDTDTDGIGDNADTDDDGDGYPDVIEAGAGTDPLDDGSMPEDLDGDGEPDASDDDIDGDGSGNLEDAFPYDANEDTDTDGDGTGDNTDTDDDDDGYPDAVEDAVGTDPLDDGDLPVDMDSDGTPDASDPDIDGDGADNADDAFPLDPSEQLDTDLDGIGNNTDNDDDGDGYPDDVEANAGTNPLDPADLPEDLDGDGIPDDVDTDDDDDGVLDVFDAFPLDATETTDTDLDGTGDNADTDDDNDGWSDLDEAAASSDPYDSTSQPADLDSDGIPDATDGDVDGDGTDNADDAFPFDATETTDTDLDGTGDGADTDDDGDGYPDDVELEHGGDPLDKDDTPDDLDGDLLPDAADPDADGDGADNVDDAFPLDPDEQLDTDGDGTGNNADVDDDDDGYDDDIEEKYQTDPLDEESTPPDADGDFIPDLDDGDLDGDGTDNVLDAFPMDPSEQLDTDLDGTGNNVDTDDDDDGYPDDVEASYGSDPLVKTSTPPDLDGDLVPDGDDEDIDGDDVLNETDVFPTDATEWADFDGDGTGDNADLDDDADGYDDLIETERDTDPFDAASTPPDMDADFLPDDIDPDIDGDDVLNGDDAFELDPAEWLDTDDDGTGNNADTDDDDDGYPDDMELTYQTSPIDAGSTPPDLDGDFIPDLEDLDIDGDGYDNDVDAFPWDPLKFEEYVPEDTFGSDYQGAVPLDANPDAFVAEQFTVIRGELLDLLGAPVQGASVVVMGHPEFGTAISTSTGEYAIAVNGGGYTTICVEREGYPRVDRTVRTPWNDIVVAPVIQMSPFDLDATAGELGGVDGGYIVHQNTGLKAPVTVVIPPTATATGTTPGGITETIGDFVLRATEYETEASMPATLPPSSDFTYCVELTVDGYDKVTFSEPVTVWLPNFTNFLVGDIVPVGYYDREMATWIPTPNGRVVELLDTDGDTIIDAVDGTGDGEPDDLTGDGGFSDEIAGVADAKGFFAGEVLWRFETEHFSPHDPNYPSGPPPDAEPPPNLPDTPPDDPNKPDPCGSGGGSRVSLERGTLQQDIPITGTDILLHYNSEWVPGFAQEITFYVSGDSVPASLEKINVEYGIAGQKWDVERPAAPAQSVSFIWDGADWQGTPTFGRQTAWAEISYVYPGFFYASRSAAQQVGQSFAGPGTEVTGVNTLGPITIKRRSEMDLFRFDQWGGVVNSRLGPGWGIGGYFTFDNATGTIIGGGGDRIQARDVGLAVDTAHEGVLDAAPEKVAADTQGNVYFSALSTELESNTIWRMSPDGDVEVYYTHDEPIDDISIDPRGGLVFASGSLVWRIPGDYMEPVAISNLFFEFFDCFAFLGSYCSLEVVVDPDGYVRATSTQVGADGGKSVVLVAPTGAVVRFPVNFYCQVGDLAVDPNDGSTLVSCANGPVRRVNPDGTVSILPGWSQYCATPGAYSGGSGMAVAPDGGVFLADHKCNRISKVDGSYGANAYLGDGVAGYTGDGGSLLGARINDPRGLALSPDGAMYIADTGNGVVRSITRQDTTLPNDVGEVLIPLGDQTALVFTDTKLLKSVRDLITGADKRTYIYDEDLRLTHMVDQAGAAVQFVHDSEDRVVQVEGPYGDITDVVYDAAGRVSDIVRPDGTSFGFGYTVGDLMTSKTTPDGLASQYVYGETGRVTSVTRPSGDERLLSSQMTPSGRRIVQTLPNGTEIHRLQERLETGETISTVGRQGGPVVETLRSADGLETVITGADGSSISASGAYDPRDGSKYVGSVTLTTPSGLTQTIERTRAYDPDTGALTESLLRNGKTLDTYEYDPVGRSFTRVFADGTSSVVTFDPDIDRIAQVDSPGQLPLTFQYDELGRVDTSAQGTHVVTMVYGDDGRVSEQLLPDDTSTAYVRDVLGRVTTATWPDGNQTHYEYTAGNEYVPEGRPTLITRQDGGEVSVEWDADYRVSSITGTGGGTTTFDYGDEGVMTATTYANDAQKIFAWDQGQVTTISYLGANGLPLEGLGPASVIYDALRRPLLLTSPSGIQDKVTWDGDLLASRERISDLNPSDLNPSDVNLSVEMWRDNSFRVTTLNVLGEPREFTYDDLDRLAAIDNVVLDYDDEGGDEEGEEATGLPLGASDDVATWAIERDGYSNDIGRAVMAGDNTAFAYTVERDETWQITSVDETWADGTTVSLGFTMDAMGRLLEVSEGGLAVEAYTWDEVGNRTSATVPDMGWSDATFTYDAGDRLLAGPDANYEYDALGHRVASTSTGGATTHYSYTPDGLLRRVDLPSGQAVEYAYDWSGRLAERAVDGTTTHRYVWGADDNLLAVTDGAGTVQERWLWLYGAPLRVDMPDGSYRIATDQVGTIRAAIDDSGDVQGGWRYDTFGNPLASTGSVDLTLGYAMGIPDDLTGLTHFGVRVYDPATGTFITPDPGGYSHGLNLYAYVDGAPHWRIDPLGLWGLELGGKFGLFGLEVQGSVGVGWNDNGLQIWGEGKAGAGASVGVGVRGGDGKLGGKIGLGAGKVDLGVNWNANPPHDGSSNFQGDVGRAIEGAGSIGLKDVMDAHAGWSQKTSYLDGKTTSQTNMGNSFLGQSIGVTKDGDGYGLELKSKDPRNSFNDVDSFNDGSKDVLLGLQGEGFFGSYANGQINVGGLAKDMWNGVKDGWNNLKNWWDCL